MNSPEKTLKKGVSSSAVLAWRQRWAQSWTSLKLRWTTRKQLRAVQRLYLLQTETNRQLLLLKELEQQASLHLHNLREMQAAREWHWNKLQSLVDSMQPPSNPSGDK